MIKTSPVAYKLPYNSVLTAEHSYEAVFEGVLRIETRLFIDDRFVGSMLGHHGKLADLRLADEDCGVRGFIYRIDWGCAYDDSYINMKTGQRKPSLAGCCISDLPNKWKYFAFQNLSNFPK
ncbi:MAG: hypothetical protein ACI4J7_10875 [Ruminiclostridium sp.]